MQINRCNGGIAGANGTNGDGDSSKTCGKDSSNSREPVIRESEHPVKLEQRGTENPVSGEGGNEGAPVEGGGARG